MSNALATISSYVEEARSSFESSVADRSINFEREAGFATQALMAQEYTLGVALKNPQSVINAVTNIAAIGLSLNPAKKQAYLVPRKGAICLDVGYIGLLDLAIGSGSIKWGQAELVHSADRFALNGVDKPPTHERDPFKTDRGEIVGAYVVVKTRDDDYLTTTMTLDELLSIRDRSEAWKAKQAGPWKTDPGEMMKKTVIKRAYKLWPKTEKLDNAIHYLNTEGEEGLPAIDNAPTKKRTGVMADYLEQNPVPEAQHPYLIELAADVCAIFDAHGAQQAHERIAADELEDNQKVFLAQQMPSATRNKIKAYSQSLRQTA